ncbi:nucleoside phosphorylase [Isosphaeraceae bacterium EP7]
MTKGPKKAEAPIAAEIGIVAALPIEVGYLTDRMEQVRKYSGPRFTILEGELEDRLVALVIAGIGRGRAREATRVLIEGHRPRWILSAGFGGSLDPILKKSDVVFPNEVVDLAGASYTIDLALPENAAELGFRSGRLLTVDSVVTTAAAKSELHSQHGATVVDMETSAVAEVCSERGVRLIPIRVISDEAGADLPREIATIMAASGSYRVGAVLGTLWKKPGRIKDLLQLRSDALVAADRLAGVVAGTIRQLPP